MPAGVFSPRRVHRPPYDHEMTEEEKAQTIAWETRQLEIMDWYTDDVDWITGETHEKIQNLFLQKGYEE